MGFLEAVLRKMGVDHSLVQLFMTCISFVTYQITHAGRRFSLINPKIGIRQGDPLSSYLFLICMEGFTALIHDFERRNLIKGVKVARNAPAISDILFADDRYIFCNATPESAD